MIINLVISKCFSSCYIIQFLNLHVFLTVINCSILVTFILQVGKIFRMSDFNTLMITVHSSLYVGNTGGGPVSNFFDHI
jgi:hypothetical protein